MNEEQSEITTDEREMGVLPPYVSPTLQNIKGREAQAVRSTVCAVCPASMWFEAESGLKCFCRVMHVTTWSNEEPTALKNCDGQIQAELERQMNASL